jgi:uncharacterized protein
VNQTAQVFYVTDIHGSEICWRKFLNVSTFYQADVVIVGDIPGKAMMPIIRRRDQWGHHFVRPACRAET